MLNSDWLIRMLEKSGTTPQARLLALFDILGDWVDAPRVRQAMEADAAPAEPAHQLLDYLERQARLAGVPEPQALAFQLHLIAIGAFRQALRGHDGSAMAQARQAAQTLLLNQTKRRHSGDHPWAYAAASGLLVAALGLLLTSNPAGVADRATTPTAAARIEPNAEKHLAAQANPVRVAALYSAIERMRNGVCQYPQALMLPSEQRAVFLESVVDGAASLQNRNPEELHQLVQKVDCYYPPVAMTAS